MKWRQRLKEVHAHLWDGDNMALYAWADALPDGLPARITVSWRTKQVALHEADKAMLVDMGHVIIVTEKGEFGMFTPDAFTASFEPAGVGA